MTDGCNVKVQGQRAGFTLVELLVVIGIIAVLVGILLPVLSKAREQGRSAACLSNLHQIYVALAAYRVDNKGDGYFYSFTDRNPPPPYLAGSPMWFSYMAMNASFNFEYDYSNGYLTKYFKNPKVLDCPGLMADFPYSATTTDAPRVSYAYNNQQSVLKRASGIKKPVETLALLDGASMNTGNGSVLANSGSSMPSSPKFPTFHGRHSGLGSVLWYDGHVTSERPVVPDEGVNYSASYVRWIPLLKKINLGYLTPVNKSTVADMSTMMSDPRINYYYWMNKVTKDQK